MTTLPILVISGSERTGSLNQRLAHFTVHHLQEHGHAANLFSLRALALPIYDGDTQAASGVPASVALLRDAIVASDAMLLVTPEYNGFPTPLVINAFDWLSRLDASGAVPGGLAATADKPTALMSASPGAAGGLRSLNYLRQFLQMQFAMLVVPQQFALGGANAAFDEAGALSQAHAAQAVERVLAALLKLAFAYRAAKLQDDSSGELAI